METKVLKLSFHKTVSGHARI